MPGTHMLSMESKSIHPIAKALLTYELDLDLYIVDTINEIAGKGLIGNINEKKIIVGNEELLHANNIPIPFEVRRIVEAVVHMAIDGQYAGYVILADQIKKGVIADVNTLKHEGIDQLMMLSGDKDSITQKIASDLGIIEAKGNLLPEDKLSIVDALKADTTKVIAFVGDGINDAPVLAISDVGIAMGGLGSDVAIETADIIIQNDQIKKIVTAIRIGKSTKTIIWQNIGLAFGVKILVLILGAMGQATMWAAVFADVGVAFLAILNAIRLQYMTWN